MKRFTAMILAALLLVSLAACGGQTTPETSETPETTESVPVYVPSPDIEVAISYINNGSAKVVTRKTSDKDLASVDLSCLYYGADGASLGKPETVQCDFATEGKLSIWTFTAPASSVYMEAVVASVTYADGTKTPCEGVSDWAELSAKEFSVDNYNKKMEEVANNQAVAAENIEAVELSVGTPADKKLELSVKNTSGKQIAEVIAYLLWFDADGAPVDKGGALVPNGEKISAKTLAVDENGTYTVTAPEGAASVKAVVQTVTYADETVWENDYVYEWTIVNYTAAE